MQLITRPFTCSLKHWPATTDLQGKLAFSIHGPDGWIYPRQIREALESVDEVPLPARGGFWAAPKGVVVEVWVRKADNSIRHKIGQRLEEQGVPLQELRLVEDPSQLQHPLPLRCDLKEVLFDSPSLFERPNLQH